MAINLIVTSKSFHDEMLAVEDQLEEGVEYVIEIKRKSDKAVGGSIKPLVEERIKKGLSNAQILKEVLELHPDAKTSKASVAWYRSQMTKKLYKPLVKSLRAENLTKDLEDKEIVALLQKNSIDNQVDAEDYFKNLHNWDEEVETNEDENEAIEEENETSED